ncbi:hypothetical protein Tco_0770423 [Tanacetum coccineum]|uniref:Transmembrane protein n=1 Tax=Tanacetum coccineum TaxID=301880 RepID=A0ABQ4ZF56_9ASTR
MLVLRTTKRTPWLNKTTCTLFGDFIKPNEPLGGGWEMVVVMMSLVAAVVWQSGYDVSGGFGGVVMRRWSVGCGDEVMASAKDGDGRSGGPVVVVIVEEVWCLVVRIGGGGVTAVVTWGW